VGLPFIFSQPTPLAWDIEDLLDGGGQACAQTLQRDAFPLQIAFFYRMGCRDFAA
jgi:hypothetical protein